jgi:hypothetical protein
VFAEQSGEWRRARNPPSFSLGAVLETASVTFGSFVGPVFPGVRSRGPEVKFAPLIASFGPGLLGVVPCQFRQHDIPAAKTGRLLGS